MKKRWVWGLAPVILAAMWLGGRDATESESVAKLVPLQPVVSDPVVAIAQGKGNEYGKTTLDAIRKAGGLEDLVKPGSTVYIKPNIVGPSPSGAGRITDYRVVQAVVNECRRLGAKRVVVGETPIDCSWDEGFSIAGYDAIKGAELIDLNDKKEDCYYMMPERSLVGQPFFIPKIYMDADVVIDVPILKTHFSAGVTLGLKNVGIGIPPKNIYLKGGNKGKLHDYEIMKTIPDISSIRRPDFTVIDGMVGGEGKGPTEPDPVECGLVIAGRDIVAVDTVGTLVMGFDPQEISHLVYASAVSRLGTMDMSRIKVVGKTIAQVQQQFAAPPDSGFPFKRTTVLQEAPSPIRIDGDVTDWQGLWSTGIGNKPQMSGDWKSWKDLSGRVSIAHDWKNVYASFTVNDDAVIPGDSASTYKEAKGDGVELALTFGMPFDQNRLRSTLVAGKDLLLSASIVKGADGKESVVVVDQSTGKPVEGAEGAVVRTASGYNVEVRIPSALVGRPELKLREEFWVNFGLIDVDAAGKGLKTHGVWTAAYDPDALGNPSSDGRAIVDAVKHPWES